MSTATDVVFILDSSDGVKGMPFKMLKRYIDEVIRDFKLSKDNVRVGIINSGEKATMPLPLNKEVPSQDEISEILSGIKEIGGKRNLAAAFNMARNSFIANDRSSGKALIAVLGDKVVVNSEIESLIKDLDSSNVNTALVTMDNGQTSERTKNLASAEDYFLQLNGTEDLPKGIDFVSRLMSDISGTL